jgi:cytochrome b
VTFHLTSFVQNNQMNQTNSTSVRLWDLPTRLFHWLFALCVIGAILTVKAGGTWMDWHPLFGIAALVLVSFRIIWGFIGPRPARFSSFVRSPVTVLRYIRKPSSVAYLGHNPAGGWAVLTLLVVVAVQAISGLFMTDDILFEGPLYPYVSRAFSGLMLTVHKTNETVLFVIIAAHLLANLIYALMGKHLIKPMITGNTSHVNIPPGAEPISDDVGLRVRAMVLIALLSAAGMWLISLSH